MRLRLYAVDCVCVSISVSVTILHCRASRTQDCAGIDAIKCIVDGFLPRFIFIFFNYDFIISSYLVQLVFCLLPHTHFSYFVYEKVYLILQLYQVSVRMCFVCLLFIIINARYKWFACRLLFN